MTPVAEPSAASTPAPPAETAAELPPAAEAPAVAAPVARASGSRSSGRDGDARGLCGRQRGAQTQLGRQHDLRQEKPETDGGRAPELDGAAAVRTRPRVFAQ